MTNHVERLHAALTVLAGHGHIKQRLIKAYEDNLVGIDEDELPIAVKKSFTDLRRQMYFVTPLNGEDPICASVRKMSPVEAGDCAIAILSVYREMLRDGGDDSSEMQLGNENRKAVPPFLVKTV